MSDFTAAQGISLNGADLVLFAVQSTIEIVAALSPTPTEAENTLDDIASRLMDIRRNIRDPRISVLLGAFAEKLARTEGDAL